MDTTISAGGIDVTFDVELLDIDDITVRVFDSLNTNPQAASIEEYLSDGKIKEIALDYFKWEKGLEFETLDDVSKFECFIANRDMSLAEFERRMR